MGLAYLLEPSFQIVDKSGNPLSNGFIEVYISGTSTKYYCYSDFNGSLHPFRIPLDAIGSNIILASSEAIYDVFIYNSFGTLVMSRHRVAPITSTTTSGYAYIFVEGTEGQIAVESTGSTDITYKVGLDDAIINELSGIHNDIQSTSSYLDNKINNEISNRTTADQYIQEQIDNLDIHNITIEQNGDGNAYTSFTKNGDTYTFNKEATYLPSANAPVVLAGENVEVSAANINGQMQYTVKANPAGNVTNLISTDETISISATSVGNDVTYDLSVKDVAGDDGAKNYAFLNGAIPVNTSLNAIEFTSIDTNGIHWNTIDQRLEFGENIKLIDLNYNVEYEIDTANGVTYEDLILYIYSDGQLLEQETFYIDTSISKHICKLNKKILNPANLQFSVKAPKNGSVNVSIDINDETFKSIAGNADASFWRGYGSLVTVSNASRALLPINATSLSNKGSDITVNNAGKFVLKKGVYFYHGNVELEADTTVYNILQKIDFTTGSNSSTFVWDRSTNAANQQITLNLCGIVNAVNDDYTLEFDIKADSAAAFYAHLLEVDIFRINGVGNGSGSGSNTVITSNDNSVTITETTAGDTTAYDLSVDAGGGSTYYAGLNIEISDNVIIGRDWTPELNTKLDTSAYTPPITYTAGDGIAISASKISVKAGKGLGFDVDKKLEVKVGDGLTYDSENKVITIDSDVSDVVASVNKLKKDLDTQITSNFDMPNIAQVYDFADPSVSTLANGACMLCQSFTIPINHEIRTVSEDADEPTLLGIYAQQGFGHKIMLALYEYSYAKAGEEHGSSTYVGDTGPVDVLLGVNEYPLKNRNPSITELRCDKVYYATLYLPNAARVNGLLLAGAPNYGTQSVPAEPRLTCAVENITLNSQELDMNDPTATLNHYQTYTIDDVTYYNYYIGPWNSGYNERWTAPRFYMQIRNGEFNEQVIPTAPFVDLGNVLPTNATQVSDIPGFTASTANTSFRDVTPLKNVTITSFEWVDNMPNVAGWAAGNCVYDSGFATNLSNNNNTASDLGSVGTVDGQTMYAHRITFNTPLTLTANTAYRFLCECFDSSSSYVFDWTTPTNVVHCGNNGWYIDVQNLTRYDNYTGRYNKLTDSNNNSYVI